jgi:DNA mismatch repair protein MutS
MMPKEKWLTRLAMAELTPMMKQYFEKKAEAADSLLFFRLGDFYEMFGDDALEASEILGITLTTRNKGENKVPMCGVPYHAAAGYIAKLTRAGRKVAICEQLSDPSLPGIVKRDIIKIITPGTTLDENVLDQKTANFLAAVVQGNRGFSLAWADLSTGEFNLSQIRDELDLIGALEKYRPAEILTEKILAKESEVEDSSNGTVNELAEVSKRFPKIFWHAEVIDSIDTSELTAQFGQIDQVQMREADLKAAALVLNFLKKTQKTELGHMREMRVVRQDEMMTLDESTIRNLEILENAREKKVEGSLLGVLDKTVTSAGGRLLKKLMVQPMLNNSAIEARLNQVEFFLKKQNLLLDLRELLKRVMDTERMLSRLSLGSGNARDLRGIVNTFQAFGEIKKLLAGMTENEEKGAAEMRTLMGKIDLLSELVGLIDQAVVQEPPLLIREGGMIAEGYNAELDEYRSLSRDGKSFIMALQAREIARTGINSLKVKFNRVFGYYIEISNSNLAQVPADYTRKQTLANAERFSTPELKEYEEKVLTAEEKIFAIEERIFGELRQLVLQCTAQIKATAEAVAYLDVLSNFALISWENNYVRPEIGEDFQLQILEGRHPVIEKLNPQDRFIPNDTVLGERARLALITGPNMGGKSTYLRQTALIVLMAHLGMYVPCRAARIPLVDRIFTRVGASDNLVRGQSTFWVEMEEASVILGAATERSLIVLDEIGRGTSTFDGVSIAWGIMEYIHDRIGAKTLFASHYHELIKLAEELPRAFNLSVKVKENAEEGVVFLYKIGQGGVDRSYGIEVARLAGLPGEVVARAKDILKDLEKEEIGTGESRATVNPERKHGNIEVNGGSDQPLDLFGLADEKRAQMDGKISEFLGKIGALNLNSLTPLEALNQLNELKKQSEELSDH